MTGVVLAFLAAVFLALAQITLRKSYKELKPSVGFFFDALFGLALWVPLALIMGVSLADHLGEALLFAFVSAILSEVIYFYALSKGEISITVTVLATYPVYTVFFSRVLNNEVLSMAMMFYVVCAIAGSVIASLPDKVKNNELKLRAEVVWPFIAAIGIGLSDTLSKGFINRSDDFSFLFALGFIQIPVAVAYARLERVHLRQAIRDTFKRLSTYGFALAGGFFNIVGTGFLWLSFYYAPASIASPVTGASGALTILLAYFVFTESLSLRKYAGIILTFFGIIGIAVLRAS